MNFLRRLAPTRATDLARAIAVLPSRFASESPLRSTLTHARANQRTADEEVPLSPNAISAPAETVSAPPHLRTITMRQPDRVDTRLPDSEQMPPDCPVAIAKGERSTTAGPLSVESGVRRVLQDAHTTGSERARLAAVVELRLFTPGAAQTHPVSPLSEAILAQRTLQPRDEDQVVHVTIGRIDVVANAAPAPPKPRNATRQATVTLSDYLRDGSGRRR